VANPVAAVVGAVAGNIWTKSVELASPPTATQQHLCQRRAQMTLTVVGGNKGLNSPNLSTSVRNRSGLDCGADHGKEGEGGVNEHFDGVL
jgi:hypothetical protein